MSEKETEVEVERSGILQNKLPAPIHPIELESQTEKKVRYRSIRIGQVALLIFSIGFSIVLTGVYPYMTQVRNPHNKPDPLLYYKMIILRYHEIFSG